MHEKKRKKGLIVFAAIVVLVVAAALLVYPHIEFKTDAKLYVCRYSDDFSEFEEYPSYNELYFYNERHDVSMKNFEVKRFLFFYVFSFDYVEGDVRETQFMLEESFIQYWLENAQIEENESGVDIAALISGKKAVVGNKRYSNDGDCAEIFYTLDGKADSLCVFESDGLTVIRVGSPDESPRYIAYGPEESK